MYKIFESCSNFNLKYIYGGSCSIFGELFNSKFTDPFPLFFDLIKFG